MEKEIYLLAIVIPEEKRGDSESIRIGLQAALQGSINTHTYLTGVEVLIPEIIERKRIRGTKEKITICVDH